MMKYLIDISKILMLLMALIIMSCNDSEEDLEDLTVKEGALLDLQATSGAFIFPGTSEVDIEFDVRMNEGVAVQSVTAFKTLTVGGETSDEVQAGTFTSFPVTATYTTNELLADVPIDGQVLTANELGPGDSWTFRFEINMADGRTLITRSLNGSVYTLNFSCESDIAGMYSASSSGNFGDGSGGQGAAYSLSATVELTEEATSGVYLIDDMSFGLYPQGYSDTAPSGRIQDVCSTISDLGDTDQYSDPFTISGTVNADGSIDISWSNTWGDTGEVVLTPN